MRRVKWYWPVLLATGISALFALQSVWQAAQAGRQFSFLVAFKGQAVEWYTWLSLLPFVAMVVKRAARSRSVAVLLLVHVLLGVPVILCQVPLAIEFARVVRVFFDPSTPFWATTLSLYPRRIPSEIVEYTLIAACLHAIVYFDKLEQQYAMLARVEQEKRRSIEVLAGTAAHDFNNLLTVIGGNALLLEQTVPAAQKNLARDIQRGADRATLVARHLLSLSKGLRVRATRVDVRNLVREADASLRETLAPGMDLLVSVPEVATETIADADLLRFVLVNLTSAVAEGAPPGSPVRIQLGAPQDGQIELRVEGSGPVLDPEKLERIFEPGVSTKRVGHGLGLTAARAIVERTGGSIRAASEGGRGIVLTIVLPLADRPGASAPPAKGIALTN